MNRLGCALLLAVAMVIGVSGGPSQADEQADPYAIPAQCAVREGLIPVTGGRVWYQVVGSGNATPLLVLHGGPGFPHDYLQPIARLCEQRPVVFYDQLGCGKSDRPTDKSLWRIGRFVRELGQVRNALALQRVHILGHSWGTTLLSEYMLTRPGGVESVIFSNPAISIPQFIKDAAGYRKRLPREVQAALDRHEANGWLQCPEYQAAVTEYYKRHVCRLPVYPEVLERSLQGLGEDVYNTMNGPNEFLVTGNLKDYDRVARLKEIRQPSLFLCGRFDETSPEATQLYHRALPGSEMIVFEKSAHVPFLEETDRYLAVVREFLTQHERSN